MKNILITGATGNVGSEVIRYLRENNASNKIVAGVRKIDTAKKVFENYPDLDFVDFDFENSDTFDKALEKIDRVFLIRPPHISDVSKYFAPLIDAMKKQHVTDVVFLSVQGAEKSKVIPHNKIERLIQNAGMDYIFLRPSYFMQNLTTSLHKDILEKREIILPAGKAKFNWIDTKDIGRAGAILLDKFEDYKNQAYEITGQENLDFGEVTSLINEAIRNPIRYRNVNPLTFYRIKKRDGMSRGMIMVMLLLHFIPRFQKDPHISDFYKQLTGKNPTDLRTFIKMEMDKFERQADNGLNNR
ncbi:MAG: NmrA family NAD(P)-binding protein [Bacteroidales bacterium]